MMATKQAQRWGILVITFVMVVGTLGSFLVMMLEPQNQAKDNERLQQAQATYEESYNEYQKKIDAQGDELSKTYFNEFSTYASRVGEYDRDSVTELNKEDLKVGEGEEITDETKFAAYYIGWNPKGVVFDQSISEQKLKAPLPIDTGLKTASLIEGWKEGMKGMCIGGVREMTIPSDQAYGEQGQGDDIPPNTPLKFVVMAIPIPETIPQPEYPAELLQGLGQY